MSRIVAAVAATLLLVIPAVATTHLTGGGRKPGDCLAGLDVIGAAAAPRARVVSCRDGDRVCDRDELVNGSCVYWVRACLDTGDACPGGGVTSAIVENADGDTDLTTISRTLDLVDKPVTTPDTCGALTKLTISLGRRANGSPRTARKKLAMTTTAADGTVDADAVTFLCKPPAKEKRRGGISFAGIQKKVFEKNCAFSGCHGADNTQARLLLTGDAVYENLVGKLAETSSAQFAGKRLVVPGAPETSFLMDKIEGKLGPGEGVQMPFGRRPLADDQVETIRKWILAGAPKDRVIAGNLAGETAEQPRIPAPTPPTGGFQAHLDPFMLGDLPETEGCQMVRLDNETGIDVGQWELFMHEGSHHFILRSYRCGDRDNDGINDCDEPDFDAQFPTGFAPCEQFGFNWAFVVGAQTPHLLVDYQTAETGVGFRLRKHQPLLLNSHYTNPFSNTMAEVWVNVTPVDSALVTHRARILFEEIANAFIKVPPGRSSDDASYLSCQFFADPTTGLPDPFCDLSGEPSPNADQFALLGLTSHRHKRATKFVADLFGNDGARVERPDDMTDATDGSKHFYVSTDWDDPVNLAFWPPIIVDKGQKLTYTCTHDNGVSAPVRLGCEEVAGVPPGKSIVDQVLGGGDTFGGAAKVCRTDADCAGFGTGRCVPANLVFGELAEDEMCIMPGLFYRCPTDGTPCVGGSATN